MRTELEIRARESRLATAALEARPGNVIGASVLYDDEPQVKAWRRRVRHAETELRVLRWVLGEPE